MIVVSCSGGVEVGRKLALKLKCAYSNLSTSFFPDGELHLQFKVDLKNKEVILVQSLAPRPNEKLVELIFAIRTAKELGASKVIVVAPYFAYVRQDIRFHPGEIVSNRIAGDMIEHAGADEFYTVATHLHRINSLSQIFLIPAQDILIPGEMAKWVKKKFGKNVVLMGPDVESLRVVKTVADLVGAKYDTFLKKRFSGTKVKNISLTRIDIRGKQVVLIDDIVSTGGTIIEAAKHLRSLGAASVSCLCVHLMSEEVGQKLLKSGIKYVAASNTVPSKFSVLDAAPEIAKTLVG